MTDCDFWQKLVLTVVDKLLLAVIVLIVGYYLNRVLEEFKGKLSREQEALKTANQAVVDLTRKLAAGSQLISWLAWGATQEVVSVRDEDFETYDKGMIEVLGDLVTLAYAEALAFDERLLKAVSGLLEPAKPRG
jgi:hypothetical protein